MSFSLDAKAEVAAAEIPSKDCCAKAMLCGILRTCGNVTIQNGQYIMQVSTEVKDLYNVLSQLIKKIYNKDDVLLLEQEEKQNHNIRYIVTLSPQLSNTILYDCYILKKNFEGDTEIVRGISKYIITDTCCERAFITGAFLGCASANIVIKDINDLKKHAGGYHLEFVFNQYELAGDFVHLLGDCGIVSKLMQRKKLYVVYLKEAEIVSDLLGALTPEIANALLTGIIADTGGFRYSSASAYTFSIAEKLIKELMNCGLRGIEAYHRKHSPAIVEYFSSMAENLGLIVTGGSDFHAPNIMNGQIILGKNFVPEWIYDGLIKEKKNIELAG
jgi:DNA-binding protein WhiA